MDRSALVILILCFGGIVHGQNGVPCHADIFPFTPRHSLDIPRYMGEWFVHEVAGSDIGNFPPPTYKCYTITMNESLPDPITNTTTIRGVDRFRNTTDNSVTQFINQFKVNATRSPFSAMWTLTVHDGLPADSPVIIMAADLEFAEWSIIYSCSIMGEDAYRYETLMAVTRSPVIEDRLRRYLKALMVGQGFRIGDHQPVDQTNC